MTVRTRRMDGPFHHALTHRLMGTIRTYPAVMLLFCLGACSTNTPEKSRFHDVVQGVRPNDFPVLDDNIRHDTLLIQTTFDMGDSTFVMVAGNVNPSFEGIRLYRYKLLPDSNAQVLASSAPGYDSWTMYPTFFNLPGQADDKLVLANFGEKESWGQKLIRMDDHFTDLGFMDVAYPERILDGDSSRVKRTNIGPYTRLAMKGDTISLSFACDSLFLFDDMAGGYDTMVPARSIRYTYHPNAGLEIWRDGQRRPVKQPS